MVSVAAGQESSHGAGGLRQGDVLRADDEGGGAAAIGQRGEVGREIVMLQGAGGADEAVGRGGGDHAAGCGHGRTVLRHGFGP